MALVVPFADLLVFVMYFEGDRKLSAIDRAHRHVNLDACSNRGWCQMLERDTTPDRHHGFRQVGLEDFDTCALHMSQHCRGRKGKQAIIAPEARTIGRLNDNVLTGSQPKWYCHGDRPPLLRYDAWCATTPFSSAVAGSDMR